MGLSQPILFNELNINIDVPKSVAQHVLAMRIIKTSFDGVRYVREEDFPPSVTPDQALLYSPSESVLDCATRLHELWREKRKLPDYGYEPRVKVSNGKVAIALQPLLSIKTFHY